MKLEYSFDKVFIRPGVTDLRKGLYSLLGVITDNMKLDPFSRSLFLFCNKNHKTIKAIIWDKTGFILGQKKVENNTWPWPKDEAEAQELTEEQLKMLLAGIDYWRAHQEITFDNI